SHVLYIPNTQSFTQPTAYQPQLGDYGIQNLRINAMYVQSPNLVNAYNIGDYTPTFDGVDFFSIPVPAGSKVSLPIPMTYKSATFFFGVFVNPGQFTGAIGQGSAAEYTRTTNGGTGTAASQTPLLLNSALFGGASATSDTVGMLNPAGNSTQYPAGLSPLNPQSDYTRTSNFYGLGGAFGGCNNIEAVPDGVVSLVQAAAPNTFNPVNAFPLVGNDLFVGKVQNLFFNMNSENIYQQPLMDGNEFYDELVKVGARTASHIAVLPGGQDVDSDQPAQLRRWHQIRPRHQPLQPRDAGEIHLRHPIGHRTADGVPELRHRQHCPGDGMYLPRVHPLPTHPEGR